MNQPGGTHIHRRFSSRAGFTLVEVMVSAAIGAMILAAVLTSYILTARGFRAISNYWELHSDGRLAIDRFAADMRAVSDITSWSATGPLVVKIPLAFSSTGVATSTKTITYSYSNGALYRTDSSTGATSMLATNIYQLDLQLYDRLGSNTTVLAIAKGIRMELFLRKTLGSQQQTEDYLSARLNMRNKS